ncbi:hypothetical protein DPMN_162875 [Dreissena polymorpha]|uniref:Uncharacterized protein n=1 Tax=Dreissena polymorpha TaxID=45954 RepID=A0A9D4ITX8_DREPO|nr:hypothetical protein DPMN_162875 [Dreissena polymorpha]
MSWHRRRLSWSLLQVSSWCGRPSETVTDCLGLSLRCPDDLGTVAYCMGVSWHGFWVPTKRQATRCRGVRGGLRSLDSMSNNTRSTDDRRSLLNPIIVARRLFASSTIVARPWSLSLNRTLLTRGVSANIFAKISIWQTGPRWIADTRRWPIWETEPLTVNTILDDHAGT